MELLLENIIIYSAVGLLCFIVIFLYLRKQIKGSKIVDEKIRVAKEEGIYEPVSLHPFVDPRSCIKSGACITACPEKDILGIRQGHATTINASRCIGHGACFHACPVGAITLIIGTEKRGVDLPHVNQNFETNVPGIYIAGELGGMGLIKNSVEQGKQATENVIKSLNKKSEDVDYDYVIVGAGPAGISAALTAKKHKLNFLIVDQDTLGGTVFSYPRSKIVMTSPMDLPLHGKIKLSRTNKSELLKIWKEVLEKNDITVKENCKIESITKEDHHFNLNILNGEKITSSRVLIATGRRGTPRKLNVPGENLEKVAYRLIEPEEISGKEILVVGGGDSAIESVLLLANENKVTLSYRGEKFSRIKPGNAHNINHAIEDGLFDLKLNTNVLEINEDHVILGSTNGDEKFKIKNDLVYIFAGGELPTGFLEKAGIKISRKFGEAVLKH